MLAGLGAGAGRGGHHQGDRGLGLAVKWGSRLCSAESELCRRVVHVGSVACGRHGGPGRRRLALRSQQCHSEPAHLGRVT